MESILIIMETKKSKGSFKTIECFSRKLYDYIWINHRFCSVEIERICADKLLLAVEQPRKKNHSNLLIIGDAVVCSQYLLREFCCYWFDLFKEDLFNSRSLFEISVYFVILQWIQLRKSVFSKFIDAAAIIAEAFLYCDVNSNNKLNLNDAPKMFLVFYEQKLEKEFVEEGALQQLSNNARDYLSYKHLLNEPFLSFKTPSYRKMKYNCDLTLFLMKLPIVFPVECSRMCLACRILSNSKMYRFSLEESIVSKLKQISIASDSFSELTSQEIDSVETICFASKYSIVTLDDLDSISENDFLCALIGEAVVGGNIGEENTLKKPKKKKRRSKKSSRMASDSIQSTTENSVTNN